MKILLNRGNLVNAKSYPFWEELLPMLGDHEVKEIKGILTEKELGDLVNWSDVWCSIDSFLPHFVSFNKLKRGIVLWGLSDPKVFGYETNINLLGNKKYLRPDQFLWWKDVPNCPESFVTAKTLYKAIIDSQKVDL